MRNFGCMTRKYKERQWVIQRHGKSGLEYLTNEGNFSVSPLDAKLIRGIPRKEDRPAGIEDQDYYIVQIS
jgi:hypothetical protein